MNEELFQLYLKGFARDIFDSDSRTKMAPENNMYELEDQLLRGQGVNRKDNPEFQAALKVFNSPLMKALS